jgi:hypothetical protein
LIVAWIGIDAMTLRFRYPVDAGKHAKATVGDVLERRSAEGDPGFVEKVTKFLPALIGV